MLAFLQFEWTYVLLASKHRAASVGAPTWTPPKSVFSPVPLNVEVALLYLYGQGKRAKFMFVYT